MSDALACNRLIWRAAGYGLCCCCRFNRHLHLVSVGDDWGWLASQYATALLIEQPVCDCNALPEGYVRIKSKCSSFLFFFFVLFFTVTKMVRDKVYSLGFRLNAERMTAFLWGWSNVGHASKESIDSKWIQGFLSVVATTRQQQPNMWTCSGLLWFHSDVTAASTEVKWDIRKQLSNSIVCLFRIKREKPGVFLCYIICYWSIKRTLYFLLYSGAWKHKNHK